MKSELTLSMAGLFVVALVFLAASPEKNADPREAARLNNIGVAYMNQQLFEKALKTFDDAAAKDPSFKVVQINRAIAMLNLQRGEEASALLEKAAKDDPKDPHIWYSLGLYYKNSSAPDKAVEAFRRVTEIDPDDADTWYFLGSTYAQLKQFAPAIDAFGRALKIDPLHASAQFGLSRAFQQSGEADRAREGLKKFQYITQNKLGSPISLVYGEQGKYSRAKESPVAVAKVLPQIPVKFGLVAENAGISSKFSPGGGDDLAAYLGSGACFLDYDIDGRIDLLLTDSGPAGGLALLHNVGGKFEDITRTAGLDPSVHALGCTTGDYDNDGFTDLVLSMSGRVLVLHNEKNGTLKDVTEQAGVKTSALNLGLTFIDFDHDGDLDLFIDQSQNRPFRERQEQWPVNDGVGVLLQNNGNGTFSNATATRGFGGNSSVNAIGTDYNNDRAIDLVVGDRGPTILRNPREGEFEGVEVQLANHMREPMQLGVAALDFDHDSWIDLAFTHINGPALTLSQNDLSKTFQPVRLPEIEWVRGFGITAFDYDNDGWVDLVAVGETKEGKGEARLFRNLGPDGWKDVTNDVGLDKIQLKEPRAIISGDYDNDGAVDLLITQNHGPAVLLRNEGGNKNNSLRLALKGLNDNKSAIGTKVEVFSEGLRQKFEVYGSSGYLGQNSPYLTIGLGQAKQADVVRMLWPTGVLQDEIEVAANKLQEMLEIDRRGSSCPTLFVWNGTRYQFVGDMLGAGVIGHWVATKNGIVERNIARPVEYIKLDRNMLREKYSHPLESTQRVGQPQPTTNDQRPTTVLSFRFMEPLEESVYLDKVQLLAVDHPADVDVYPNEYFASNPPFPKFKIIFSKDARPPAGAWDEHGHDVLPDLLARRFIGDFKVLSFPGFTEPHTLELDLGEPYQGGPLWLLMHGEIEYFTATSMYAADQAGIQPFAPYLEALVPDSESTRETQRHRETPKSSPSVPLRASVSPWLGTTGKWVRVLDDLGFPAGGPRTMTADLTDKLPRGTRRIRFTTNLQVYWDNILISRTPQRQAVRLTPVPLVRADLSFRGFPLKIEGTPPGNVNYIYEQVSATGPYSRPAGAYTRHGDVRALLHKEDDRFTIFGSGDDLALDFDPAQLPALPPGWVRDYFFAAHGYEKDMDFYAYRGDSVEPLPFRDMGTYPYPGKSFPRGPAHEQYLLEYNTRFMSGKEATGYSFRYPPGR